MGYMKSWLKAKRKVDYYVKNLKKNPENEKKLDKWVRKKKVLELKEAKASHAYKSIYGG